MAGDENNPERLESEVRDMEGMQLKEEEDDDSDMDTIPVLAAAAREVSGFASGSGTPASVKRQSRSPIKQKIEIDSPAVKSDNQETVGGDVTLKLEPGKPPKLSRSTSHKIEKRSPRLFFDHDDSTEDSKCTFDVLPHCTYANKSLGSTEHALECDCAEDWGELCFINHSRAKHTPC